MEKSRQGKGSKIKASLERLRELALAFFSLMLWIFSLLAFVTVIFTLLGVDLYYVQLIRTILKITRTDLMTLIMLNLIGGIIIIAYLTITYNFGPFKKKRCRNKRK